MAIKKDKEDKYQLPTHHRPIDEIPPRGSGSGEFRPFKRWFPWLVPAFVVANVAVFVATMYINDCPVHQLPFIALEGDKARCLFVDRLGRFAFQPFKENPLLGPSSATLLKMGALEGRKMINTGQGWRMLTCMWLHGGVFHVLANMLSLVLIGIRLEQEFGFVRIGILYIISGLGGSLLSALFIEGIMSVGASGALFGLLGSMLSELLTNWTIYENKLSALTILVLVIGINLAIGLLPHVDNFAHIGGFITGFLLGFIILIRPQFGYINNKNAPPRYQVAHKQKHKVYQIILLVLSAIILVGGFVVGFIVLYKGINVSEKCSWCHFMSCLPTSKWSCNKFTKTCVTSTFGNKLNLTCEGTTKWKTYFLPDPNATDTIYKLCTDLCG